MRCRDFIRLVRTINNRNISTLRPNDGCYISPWPCRPTFMIHKFNNESTTWANVGPTFLDYKGKPSPNILHTYSGDGADWYYAAWKMREARKDCHQQWTASGPMPSNRLLCYSCLPWVVCAYTFPSRAAESIRGAWRNGTHSSYRICVAPLSVYFIYIAHSCQSTQTNGKLLFGSSFSAVALVFCRYARQPHLNGNSLQH